jgi:cellulose synthase/poly-beta-1,6-N-acetylglucosamine synthase-like glycosyltransferase
MPQLRLPHWIKSHLFINKNYDQLSAIELSELRLKLRKFQSEKPDVSVVIPAYNEENNIYRTLSSLASNLTTLNVEIIVINNNSTDRTQEVLDALGVRSYFQPQQGIAYARQLGLAHAKGKYHLCADADSLYPPLWIEIMTRPLIREPNLVCVYGRYSIMPPANQGRFGLFLYESLTGLLFRMRRKNKEFINVLGFNMGFVTELGRQVKGFHVKEVRKFNNAQDSQDYTEVSEDGTMALLLAEVGRLKMVTDKQARVFTSSRKLMDEGSIAKAFWSRIKKHTSRLPELFVRKQVLSAGG